MFFSRFKLPMTWNAAAYHEEWKSTSEYPYFGCYLFHSFKNILQPRVVWPETKYAGSPVSQNFEIPAVQQQEWWKLQGDLTWHGVLHAGRLLGFTLCALSWDSRPWKCFGNPASRSSKIHWCHYISRLNISGWTGQQFSTISVLLKSFL